MQSDAAKQIARWVALGALFLIPITPLIVADGYFFPFITGKAFFFRILAEIAFSAWVALALLDKEYRPRFSLVGAAALAFVVWMFVVDAFAPNAAKAFWSNFERMEGWVLLAHLLGFFFAASAVLRVEKRWRAWFLTSLAVSVVIVGYAFLQLSGAYAIHQGSSRIDATLGNSAYLAIYLLFNVFIALWLALTEKYAWLKWLLIALAATEGVLVFFTGTRGAVLGLVGALALIIVLAGSFYLARNSDFVQNNYALQRIASISLADGETRFTIWNMAFKGVLERPLTGWGQEGFNYVFNKQYDPSLYAQEQWFDRAHNAFIDWLSAGGFPAFLLYLSLFGSALFMLWRSSELSRPERIALTSALAGYAVHNFFVFDNLYSYIYFFALLALIDSQIARPIKRFEDAPVLNAEDGMTYALPVAVVAAFALVWSVNISGMRVAGDLIKAISPSQAGIGANIAAFESLAADPSFAAQEMREQLVSFAAAVAQSQSATNEEKQRALSLALIEMNKQVSSYPNDARARMQLSYAYRVAGDTPRALEEIRAAIALSPRKIGFLIEAGATEWGAGNTKAAREYFNTAYDLGRQFQSLAVYAAAGAIADGDIATGDEILLAAYGTTSVDSNILAVAYFILAESYYKAGDKTSAINMINKAAALHPASAPSAAAAIKQIEGK